MILLFKFECVYLAQFLATHPERFRICESFPNHGSLVFYLAVSRFWKIETHMSSYMYKKVNLIHGNNYTP